MDLDKSQRYSVVKLGYRIGKLGGSKSGLGVRRLNLFLQMRSQQGACGLWTIRTIVKQAMVNTSILVQMACRNSSHDQFYTCRLGQNIR
jgi:hypothetical protein